MKTQVLESTLMPFFSGMRRICSDVPETRRGGNGQRSGFTLAELLVVITIILVLAALTFLVASQARESARRSASAANLRQFGVAFNTFAGDNAGCLPAPRYGSTYWPQTLWPYVQSLDVFLIPSTPRRPMSADLPNGYFDMPDKSAKTPEDIPIRWNYMINGGGLNLPFSETYPDGQKPPGMSKGVGRPFMQLTDPSRTLMMTEGSVWWINGNTSRIRTWPNGTANILWCDGSLQFLNPKSELRASDYKVVK